MPCRRKGKVENGRKENDKEHREEEKLQEELLRGRKEEVEEKREGKRGEQVSHTFSS